METLAESKVFAAYLDPRGFVEFIVKDAKELQLSDVLEFGEILLARKINRVKILVNRLHDYSTDASILISSDKDIPFHLDRLAYLVYTPTTEHISKYIGDLVLKKCPHEIFHDRESAISWLLEEGQGE